MNDTKALELACKTMLEALEAITSNEYIDLGDLIYKVCDSEGKGWNGPEVKAWSAAVEKVNKALILARDIL